MEAKHTPGPWGAKKSETGPWAIFGADGNWIATTCKKQFPSEDIANARLIAAAPELLAALVYVKQFEANRGGSWADLKQVIDTAISKATGA